MHMPPISENKNVGRSTAYLRRTNVFIQFQHLMKKIDTAEEQTNEAKHFQISGKLWVFVNCLTFQWLGSLGLKSETEGIIIAVNC